MIELIVMAALAGAPVMTKDYQLDCPAGTRQVRTADLLACQEGMRDGARVFHGPFISLYPSGAVEAVGQSDHGFRSGTWAFYDEQGTLTGETGFKRGNFDGRRAFFHPDGRVKSQELYAEGRLIAPGQAPSATVR